MPIINFEMIIPNTIPRHPNTIPIIIECLCKSLKLSWGDENQSVMNSKVVQPGRVRHFKWECGKHGAPCVTILVSHHFTSVKISQWYISIQLSYYILYGCSLYSNWLQKSTDGMPGEHRRSTAPSSPLGSGPFNQIAHCSWSVGVLNEDPLSSTEIDPKSGLDVRRPDLWFDIWK